MCWVQEESEECPTAETEPGQAPAGASPGYVPLPALSSELMPPAPLRPQLNYVGVGIWQLQEAERWCWGAWSMEESAKGLPNGSRLCVCVCLHAQAAGENSGRGPLSLPGPSLHAKS